MIGYVTLGSNDLEKAKTFYDALLEDLGGKRGMGMDRIQFFVSKAGEPMLAVCEPYDKQPATSGNGTMVSLSATSPEMVDKLHAKALSLGATDEGAPGIRIPGFYGGYFRDLDGNKLCVFKFG